MNRYERRRRRSMSRRILNRAHRQAAEKFAIGAWQVLDENRTPRPLTAGELAEFVEHLARIDRGDTMTIIEEQIRYLEQRMLEEHAKIEASKAELVRLEREKQQILERSARAGLERTLDRD